MRFNLGFGRARTAINAPRTPVPRSEQVPFEGRRVDKVEKIPRQLDISPDIVRKDLGRAGWARVGVH